MSRRVVPVAWALAGKRPGDKSDYRLLAGNAPDGDDRALADHVWAALPVNPQLAGVPGPGEVPWVTVIPGHDASGDWLAVTVTDATADRDAVGRPSVAIRQVRISYPDVAKARAGYQALYAAVPAAEEMATPLAFHLAPGSGGRPVALALADDRCFDRAATLASLVLDGDVMITMTTEAMLPLIARLAELDQVMALLPFGMRAGTAMATWYDGTAQADADSAATRPPRYRLAYGPFPAHGQPAAPLGERPPPPASDIALAYLRELRAARAELGGPALIAHLEAHRDALAPAGQEHREREQAQALEILRSLRDPGRVVAAIRDGQPNLERILNARRRASDRLTQADRDAIDEYLVTQDDRAARQVVLDAWSERTALVAARAVLSRLARFGDPGPGAWEIYEWSVRAGEDEAFLASLAQCRTSDGRAVPEGLVARFLMAVTEPRPGNLPALRAELWRRPELARAVLGYSLRGAQVDRRWLGWLAPAPGESAPTWLAPYTTLAMAPASRADPGALVAEPEDLALIASFACRRDPDSEVAGPWWPVLLRFAGGDPNADAARERRARGVIIALVDALDEPAPTLALAIRLDTLRLYLTRPVRLPLDNAAECLRYLGELWALWSRPPIEADRAVLVSRLLSRAARQLASAPSRECLVDGAVVMLRDVADDVRVQLSREVGTGIAAVLMAAPELMADPRLEEDWWARVERVCEGVRSPKARLAAALRDPAASPEDIAVRMGHAAIGGMSAEEMLALTGQWLASRESRELGALLQIAEGVLRLYPAASQAGGPGQASPPGLLDPVRYISHLAELLPPPGPGPKHAPVPAQQPGQPPEPPPSWSRRRWRREPQPNDLWKPNTRRSRATADSTIRLRHGVVTAAW